MRQFFVLSRNDFKLIFRDKPLRIFLMMPALILAVVFLAIPYLTERYDGVDPFVPLILMAATVQTSTMFGFIYSIVLIHEKDTQVAKVYGILPVSRTGFVTSRLVIPFLISSLLAFVILFFQPFFSIALVSNLLLSVLCGLLAPLLAVLVCLLSKNKMAGLSWFKIVNLFVSLPLAAFFIPSYADLFGILPTHWIFQSLDHMVNSLSYSVPIIIGFLYFGLFIFFLVRRFARVHYR